MYNKIVSTQRSAGQILLIAATLDQEHTNLRVAALELSSPQRLQRISVSARSTLAAFPRNRLGIAPGATFDGMGGSGATQQPSCLART